MAPPIVTISTFEIQPGKLEELKESLAKSIAFLEANGPQLMVSASIDEQAMRMYGCQIQPDSEAILAHWQMSDPYIRDVSQYLTARRLDVYGQPSEEVMEGLRPFADAGVVITVTPTFTGFSRLQPQA